MIYTIVNILIDDLLRSPAIYEKRHLDTSILDDLNAKYVTLIGELKEVFEEEKERYPVRRIITGLCTADKHNLTFFSSERCLRSAKTTDDVFFYIGRECKYFDFTLLKTFIDGSRCTKARDVMENYIKELEESIIINLNLKLEFNNAQIEGYAGSTKKLEISCDKSQLNIKELNLIVDTLHRCLKLPRASIQLIDVVHKCIILVCRILPEVEYYLLQHKFIACELKPLSLFSVTSLKIDGKTKLIIPLDCDTEVCAKF